MRIHERDALREKMARAQARLSKRASALVADREQSGRLMVQTHTKVAYHAPSAIASETGLCRHDLPLDVCAACRRLVAYKSETRYATVAKRKIAGVVGEVSVVKSRGRSGTPQGAPSKGARQRQVAVRQVERLPREQSLMPRERKPALFPVLATDGGTRHTKSDNVEADMRDALKRLANSKIVASTPRVSVGKDGPYCIWSAPIVRPMPEVVPFSGQSWTPLEVAEKRKQRNYRVE